MLDNDHPSNPVRNGPSPARYAMVHRLDGDAQAFWDLWDRELARLGFFFGLVLALLVGAHLVVARRLRPVVLPASPRVLAASMSPLPDTAKRLNAPYT